MNLLMFIWSLTALGINVLLTGAADLPEGCYDLCGNELAESGAAGTDEAIRNETIPCEGSFGSVSSVFKCLESCADEKGDGPTNPADVEAMAARILEESPDMQGDELASCLTLIAEANPEEEIVSNATIMEVGDDMDASNATLFELDNMMDGNSTDIDNSTLVDSVVLVGGASQPDNETMIEPTILESDNSTSMDNATLDGLPSFPDNMTISEADLMILINETLTEKNGTEPLGVEAETELILDMLEANATLTNGTDVGMLNDTIEAIITQLLEGDKLDVNGTSNGNFIRTKFGVGFVPSPFSPPVDVGSVLMVLGIFLAITLGSTAILFAWKNRSAITAMCKRSKGAYSPRSEDIFMTRTNPSFTPDAQARPGTFHA